MVTVKVILEFDYDGDRFDDHVALRAWLNGVIDNMCLDEETGFPKGLDAPFVLDVEATTDCFGH